MKRYLEARLDVARETGGEGLIAELVRVEKEGERISAGEMVGDGLSAAGGGHGDHHAPEQRHRLRANEKSKLA